MSFCPPEHAWPHVRAHPRGPAPKAAHENARRDWKERVKCYDLIAFREESMSDQMKAVREKVIDVLRTNDVKKASFFGSIVRGEMTEESDVDLLVEFEGKKSLLDLAHLKNELEDAINRRVDVLTYKSLHPRLKERILAEQVPII
jgi:predicted nucleotidyltransferase